MAIDLHSVGRTFGPSEVSWNARDAMLYALGVGAGQQDPFDELQLTTENTAGVTQKVLPAYAVVLTQNAAAKPEFGPIDRTKLVHAEQGFELHRPLPLEGRVSITTRITGIFDKGSGALASTESVATDLATGQPLLTARSSVFIRGEGGFGGEKGPPGPTPVPQRAPDFTQAFETRADLALLYRLSGDRNPLHSDPAFAARGGFTKPILHGMCTYGITSRLLIRAFCDGDPDRLKSMHGRFTRPVLPGDTLVIQGWRESGVIRFRTLGAGGEPVLDAGTAVLRD